jgi:hypothetical protein
MPDSANFNPTSSSMLGGVGEWCATAICKPPTETMRPRDRPLALTKARATACALFGLVSDNLDGLRDVTAEFGRRQSTWTHVGDLHAVAHSTPEQNLVMMHTSVGQVTAT